MGMNIFHAEVFHRPATEELRFLPECPRRLRSFPGLLAWVGIQNKANSTEGCLNLLNLSTKENRSFPLPGRPGFFCETNSPGVLVVGLERRLALYDLNQGALEETGITVSADEDVIINDGLAIEDGIIFGCKHLRFTEKRAGLYWFDCRARRLHQLRGDQICSNGKHLYKDGSRHWLLDIDSFAKTVARYEFDSDNARLIEAGIVADFREGGLFPDGMRPTPDGRSVVVAFYNPEAAEYGLARQFRIADGAVEAEWKLPGSPRVTCPEYVEIGGKVKLLFTTAVEAMPDEIRRSAPEAGAMFIADSGHQPLPPPPPTLPAGAFRAK
ncbi:MAG: SMP-30/gluconolactonase/LRE family protein [Acidimicrobiia bacterium]|nr:SMP-30/gluconolactonase/LRE family protein [Acidimicrobiia bacterium]